LGAGYTNKLSYGLYGVSLLLSFLCCTLIFPLNELQNKNNTLEEQITEYQLQESQIWLQNKELLVQIEQLGSQIVALEEQKFLQQKAEEGAIEIVDVERGWYSGSWGAGSIDIEVTVKNYGYNDVHDLVLELSNTNAGIVDDIQSVGFIKAGSTKTITLRGGYSFVIGAPNLVTLMLNGKILDSEPF
jgi:hypothetical protein